MNSNKKNRNQWKLRFLTNDIVMISLIDFKNDKDRVDFSNWKICDVSIFIENDQDYCKYMFEKINNFIIL
jgi:hypothetical protein